MSHICIKIKAIINAHFYKKSIAAKIIKEIPKRVNIISEAELVLLINDILKKYDTTNHSRLLYDHGEGSVLNHGIPHMRRDSQTAYIMITDFMVTYSALDKFCRFFDLISDCQELIIDLRHCHGGMVRLLEFVLSNIMRNEQMIIGDNDVGKKIEKLTLIDTININHNNGIIRYKVGLFTGRVYVLIGAGTYSAGEMLAFTVQQTKRGRVFGNSNGGMHTKTVYFPVTGALNLQIPILDTSIGSVNFEGGVKGESIECTEAQACLRKVENLFAKC